MEMILKIRDILFKPASFFKGLKREKGIKKVFKYLFILCLFSAILMFLPTHPFLAIISLGIGLVSSFIIAAILHVWILLFGGKKGYEKTYQLYVYSSTPRFLATWILLGFAIFGIKLETVWVYLLEIIYSVGVIYSLVLLTIGTQKMHDVSRKRSIFMYLVVFLLFSVSMVLAMIVEQML
jgi:hypothetical protein